MSKETKEVKVKNYEELKAKLEKDYGKGTIIGANEKAAAYDHIPTGSLGLDKALGIGGLPRGRIIEIYGPESSGKTTMCLEVMKQAMDKYPDKLCGFIDVEHALDVIYAENLGIDLKKLKICQPMFGEEAMNLAEELITSELFSVIVVDSVAALTPKAEIEGEMGDAQMGKQARLMSQALRKLVAINSKTNTLLMFTNQMRDKIGQMFGSPETTTGGNALKFYASVRLDIRRSLAKENVIMEDDVKIGNLTKIKVVKNKMAPPFRECEFDIIFGEGVDKSGELLQAAVDSNVIEKKGQWYAYNTANIAQGREAAKQFLKDNIEMAEEIKQKVIELFVPKEFEPTEVESAENS